MNLTNIIAQRKDKTIYRDGNKAIKIFDENYKTSAVLNEALNDALIEETSLNVPKLREVSKI